MDVKFWKATGIRCLRTFITTILGVWTGGQLVTEINWKTTLITAVSCTLYIFLLCILAGLPEVKLEKSLYDLDNPYPYESEEDEEDDEEGDDDGTSVD